MVSNHKISHCFPSQNTPKGNHMKYSNMLEIDLQGILQKNTKGRFLTMYEMLMNLFNGNFRPAERKSAELPLQKFHSKECDNLKQQLEATLNEDERKLLTKLLEAYTVESTYTDMDAFITGFRMAALIMVDVFHDKHDLLDNKEQFLRHLLHRPFKGTPLD